MNKTKLTALCAKVRGISPAEMAAICYDPLDDANQADDLLEYVAENEDNGVGYSRDCKTQNLVKILCALRASDKVTDAEIEEALK